MATRRVIVLLNDLDMQDHFAVHKKIPSDRANEQQKYINAKMQLLNSHTLLVANNITQTNAEDSLEKCLRQLHFSHLGFASDESIHIEVFSLLDELFLKHQQCCLIRFNALRECQIRFLCNFLVKEIQKRLRQQKTTVEYIKLDYYFLHKYNLVNVIDKRQSESNGSTGILFYNFSQLLKWLQSEYTNLFSFSNGHEHFDFQFSLTDTKERRFRLNFVLIHYYLCIMDGETKTDMKNVLEYMNPIATTNQSMIVKCLKDYLMPAKNSWHLYMLFDIPIIDSDSGTIITDDILQVACAAEKGLRSFNNTPKLESNADIVAASCSKMLRNQNVFSVQATTRKSQKEPLLKEKSFVLSNKDLNNISYWHCKIDEIFSSVLNTRENYYKYKFETKVCKMCTDIKQMVHKSSYITNTPSQERCLTADLEKLKRKYQSALTSFESLLMEVEKSEYAKELSVYYQIKKYELIQHSLRFKVKQLEQCQHRLTTTIDDEMSVLKSMKQPTESETVSISSGKNIKQCN